MLVVVVNYGLGVSRQTDTESRGLESRVSNYVSNSNKDKVGQELTNRVGDSYFNAHERLNRPRLERTRREENKSERETID